MTYEFSTDQVEVYTTSPFYMWSKVFEVCFSTVNKVIINIYLKYNFIIKSI